MSAAVKLLKKGLHEVPHMIYGGAVFALSFPLLIYVYNHWERNEKGNRIWKRRYTVVREEDFDPKTQIHRPERRYPIFG